MINRIKCLTEVQEEHSTGTCLVGFLDHIFQNMDRGCPSGVLFLDLSKAFDTVNHEHLLSKLRKLGFKWKAVNWVASYLYNRSQVTKVGNDISSARNVLCGVPQGSILGPLLFTLYVNDLPSNISLVTISLYADDTAIVVSGHDAASLKDHLQTVMSELILWFGYNRLSLNLKKSKNMIFGTNAQVGSLGDISIQVGQNCLDRVYNYKYLEIILDPRLSFADHVDYIKKKTFPKIKNFGTYPSNHRY